MRLVMLRHAATDANLAHRYEGSRTDAPLSAHGLEQCRRARTPLQVKRVYVSTMQRARQTARTCFEQAELVAIPGLEEFDFGVFEGRTAQQMEQDAQYRLWVNSGCTAPCPNGDTLRDYTDRVAQAITHLLQESAAHDEKEVVVIAHAGTIMATFSSLAVAEKTRRSYFDWHAPNCGGYQATVCVDGNQVELCDVSAIDLLS